MAKDLTGQTFDKLTVLRIHTKADRRHEGTWQCACECGTTAIVLSTGQLLRSAGKKGWRWDCCGCTKEESLIGKTFGKLTIIGRFVDTSAAGWLCTCACGAQGLSTNTGYLNSHSRKGCVDCVPRKIHDNNIVGKRFGNLVVTSINKSKLDAWFLWECACDCGRSISVPYDALSRSKRPPIRSCGCVARKTAVVSLGSSTSNWRGGERITKTGYKYIYTKDHPNRVEGCYVFEHRLVMEAYLNRYLLPHETVHHLNGDRLDNRLSNLELWSSAQPYGQRASDKVAFAREILQVYAPEDLVPSLRSPTTGVQHGQHQSVLSEST